MRQSLSPLVLSACLLLGGPLAAAAQPEPLKVFLQGESAQQLKALVEDNGGTVSHVVELAQLIGNERKAGYLHSAARAFHQVDEDWLRAAPRDAVRQWLLQIKGIGPWSADFILIRGLGHMERIDVGQEKRLMAAIRRVYGPQTSAAQAQEIADSYGEWQGYWAHYLRAAS